MKRVLILFIVLTLILSGCAKEEVYLLDDLNNGDKVGDFAIDGKYMSDDKREVSFELNGEGTIRGELQYGSGLHEDRFLIISEKSSYDSISIDIKFEDEYIFRPTFKVFVIRNEEMINDELKDYLIAGNKKSVKVKVDQLIHWSRWESEFFNLISIKEITID